MKPNSCAHDFEKVSREIIPNLIKKLEQSRKSPWRFSDFDGISKASSRKQLGTDSQDFAGCYLLSDKDNRPKYVGISRGVIGRVWTHYKGNTHHQTSLVYKLARGLPESTIQHHRKETGHENYRTQFEAAQKSLRQWTVAHVAVDDAVTLYLLEVAAAMHFKTGILNCFRTH